MRASSLDGNAIAVIRLGLWRMEGRGCRQVREIVACFVQATRGNFAVGVRGSLSGWERVNWVTREERESRSGREGACESARGSSWMTEKLVLVPFLFSDTFHLVILALLVACFDACLVGLGACNVRSQLFTSYGPISLSSRERA
jgi:hypothetical protein